MTRAGRRLLLAAVMLAGCGADEPPAPPAEYFGTLEPFAAEAVYFIVTDRFVDGDPSNNHKDQGGERLHTFDRPVQIEGLPPGNIGYLGGDFKGVIDNAAYIADMGFTAVWLTPVVDNPDEAFTGGAAPGEGGSNDRGKAGYHGYWGVNFFELDEHLPSPGLDYAALTARLREEHGIKTVLDIVCNHGSPAFTMPEDQPKFGELYAADGTLVADHQNLLPSELSDDDPLHAFYRRERDLAELADLDHDNPDVLDYCASAQLHWIGQGAAAIRIDTIKHMPHRFWKAFADRIRAGHPGLFMFAEAWDFDPAFLATFTYPENGGISVLDFPGRAAMLEVFGSADAPLTELEDYLHLETGVYRNPYELMTFYDNHDMPRIDANEAGFIDANHWLFTSRGIPVVYYGSEIGFRAGQAEHSGNRDYFGQANVERAKTHPVRAALARVAAVRKGSIALQRGLMATVAFTADTAVFFRVYQKDGVHETALVMLNAGDAATELTVDRWLSPGDWRDAVSGEIVRVAAQNPELALPVSAHGIRVLLSDAPVTNADFRAELDRLQQAKTRP